LEDRDNCKKALKLALVSNQERIISETAVNEAKKLKTIADWIKDYVGIAGNNTLNKAQYFYQRSYLNKLNQAEKEILRKLFSLYDFLSASSMTPEGFEDDLLMRTEDGKIVTTNKGKVVVLHDPNAENKIPPKRNIPEKKISPAKSVQDSEQKTDEWQNLLDQYPIGSLERKAIEEEMKKQKK
jgi:hypothetical protein